MRQIRTLVVLACIVLTACGGGSSDESDSGGSSSGRPKATRTPRPATPVPEPPRRVSGHRGYGLTQKPKSAFSVWID